MLSHSSGATCAPSAADDSIDLHCCASLTSKSPGAVFLRLQLNPSDTLFLFLFFLFLFSICNMTEKLRMKNSGLSQVPCSPGRDQETTCFTHVSKRAVLRSNNQNPLLCFVWFVLFPHLE